jgi:hypothetical protein
MKTNISNLMMVVLISLGTYSSHADTVRDGGMSGGGGGTAPSNPVTEQEVKMELASARVELYLYFNTLSIYEIPMEPRVDAIKDKILPIIQNVPIHASSDYCLDKFGTPVDGSIYSPRGHAICITIKNMVKKLHEDNLKTQISGLVAHEYAHLAGLGEADAVYIQDWIISSFSGIAGDRYRLLQNAKETLLDIEMNIYEASSREVSWNSLCYASELIERAHLALSRGSVSGVLNLYDLPTQKMNTSFILKNLLLRTAVCGFSDYHPRRDLYRRNYQNDFGNYPERLDSEMEGIFWNTKGLVSGRVMMKKVVTLGDGMSELLDIQKYTKEAKARIEMIENLGSGLLE